MSSSPGEHVWAVILAGGVGSRFWPVSTRSRPKQVLPLSGHAPLIAETVDRIRPLVPAERLRILAGHHLAEPLLAAAPTLTRENLWIEPAARGTAPVLAWAAARIAAFDPDAVMVSLHADHVISPAEAFRTLIARVAALAQREPRLFTIGVEPGRPETGYGYIRLGQPLADAADVFEVRQFVEKPDLDTARSYLQQGGYVWNSGIFVWRVDAFLDEIGRHTPELASLLPLIGAGDAEAFFQRAPSLSVDEGVLERSRRVAVARATFRWDDVGTWDALGRTREADAQGNVTEGDAHVVDSRNCVAWSEDGAVVVFGADDLVVVRTARVTLVAPRSRAADLKALLRDIPEQLRDEGS